MVKHEVVSGRAEEVGRRERPVYTRRDFLLKFGIPAVGGGIGVYFLGNYLVRLLTQRPEQQVVPPLIQPASTPQPTATPIPKYSPIPEWDGEAFLPPLEYVLQVRERMERAVPKASRYPDVLSVYPYWIVRYISSTLPFFNGRGDLETAFQFYQSLEPEFVRNLEIEIEEHERGRRPLPLVNDDGNGRPLFANHNQYLMNLGETLFEGGALDWDPRKGPVGYNPVTDTRRSRTVDDLKETFARNVNQKREVKKEIVEELYNPELFRQLISQYAKYSIVGRGIGFEKLADRFLEYFNTIAQSGKPFERIALADRGYTRTKWHHDTGRSVTEVRLWAGGAVAYNGDAYLPTYIRGEHDGVTFFPISDQTSELLPTAIFDKYTHSTSFYLADESLLRDTKFKNEHPITRVRIAIPIMYEWLPVWERT